MNQQKLLVIAAVEAADLLDSPKVKRMSCFI